jgi:hypothetical protein
MAAGGDAREFFSRSLMLPVVAFPVGKMGCEMMLRREYMRRGEFVDRTVLRIIAGRAIACLTPS